MINLNCETKVKPVDSKILRLSINGKFLEQKSGRSGVYRVAYEMIMALDDLLDKDCELARNVSCCLLVPKKANFGLKTRKITIEHSGRFATFLNLKIWEQFVLPKMAKGRTLINLCNLGPIKYRNSFTMIHDAQVSASPKSYSLPFRMWYRFIQPRLAKANRAILTVSQFSRDQLDKYGVASASRVFVVHNGCDHVLRVKADTTIVQKKGLLGKKYVVALSNTQKHKNISILFQAFRSESLSDVTLALFGSANRDDFEKLGHAVPSNVEFLGRLSDEELSGLLIEANALAFPSTTEGFGLPPLEAMLLGCPVVAAPCGALVEVCCDAVLWAEPHLSSDWEKQLSKLCNDSDFAKRLAMLGIAHAKNFTWKKAAQRLIDVIAMKG